MTTEEIVFEIRELEKKKRITLKEKLVLGRDGRKTGRGEH